MATASPRLLVLACSGRKRSEPHSLPAIQRYDGPAFRVLRKYLRTTPQSSIHTFVLSAEYGLIAGSMSIPPYDRRMTRKRAEELRPYVAASFARLIEQTRYVDVFLCMGRDYLEAIDGSEPLVTAGTRIVRTTGSIGRHLSDLHTWLRKGDMLEPRRTYSTAPGRATIRGIELALSPNEILETASTGIARAGAAASRYQSWYVQVGNERVAPKWLVGQLTGLPVSAFRTADARRALTDLGVEVRRV